MTDEEMKRIISQAALDEVDSGLLTNGRFQGIPKEDRNRFRELIDSARVSVTWDGDKP